MTICTGMNIVPRQKNWLSSDDMTAARIPTVSSRPDDPPVAVLDTSAAAHMPDVLEMPYRPEVVGAGQPGEKRHTYQLAGLSCLAGDVIGYYSFEAPLKIGQKLVFLDMLHYTMVKNNTFNGVQLPAIATYDPDGDAVRVVKEFGYRDYRSRLS